METSGAEEEEEAAAAGPAQMVKVKRKILASCLTCPICNKLMRDATTISECLHTFCRNCIYEKLDEEETDRCPVCNIHLGCLPVEKLRADHNLQDLRAKIFPLKKLKNGACDSISSITLPVRRKEISLSSLVVNTPKVTTQTGSTGRRKKALGNKDATFHGSGSISCKNENDTTNKFVKKSNSNGNSIKQALSCRQASSNSKTPYNNANKHTENGDKAIQDNGELWKPLNCLVEAANRTKSFRSTPQNPIIKAEKKELSDGDTNRNKTIMEHLHDFKAQDQKNDNFQTVRMKVKARSLKAVNQKKSNLANSTQTLPDAFNARSDKRITPLWFSLIAYFDQTGDSALPQISTNYLRIKDDSIPVSYIQKYLVKKLNLFSEDEVEITCHNEPLMPTICLHNVIEQWLQGARLSQRLPAVIGASAKEFVVTLGYRRSKTELEPSALR
ncbi:E3 ubiquitin protein ligase DRIP2-like isoform X1 [Zingiber officinale]|uniref:E3 ubiquitin protein ligase DRIP2-like isoform X1 n=1 Tax=Zingiber officinale TaxID=94328 RepID=UPI001C4B17EB|nr:E3 ubiquitin protein ligase DRIP2-like isoform X1 [Zingiber officinale]